MNVLEVMDAVAEGMGGPTDLGLREARATVAELLLAAEGVVEMEHEPRFLYGAIRDLRNAIAKATGETA